MSLEEEAPVASAEDEFVEKTFDYDEKFQSKIAALALRDDEFLRRTSHIIRPDFFENEGEARLVNIALEHFGKYQCAPDPISVAQIIKDQAAKKILKGESLRAVIDARKVLIALAVHDKEYVEDKVVEFARKQGMSRAILNSVEHLESGSFDKIETLIKEALTIGLNDDGYGFDYYATSRIRQIERIERLTGKVAPRGITSGNKELDNLLLHNGWGRKELTLFMGGPKSGKTQALINFARAATWAKANVLYVTLEVGANIIQDRMDAAVAGVVMKELAHKAASVADAVDRLAATSGKLIIHEYASGTFSPAMLRKLVERYKNPGRNPDGSARPPIKFDMVVVDYADLMAPSHRTKDPIENSKQIYTELRAIGFEENVAMLTATQTNREGHKSTVAKMDHVAEDFNKIRIADLVISINKTEEEAARNEARLYFAASRNQESGFTVVIRQNVAMMRFLESVVRVE